MIARRLPIRGAMPKFDPRLLRVEPHTLAWPSNRVEWLREGRSVSVALQGHFSGEAPLSGEQLRHMEERNIALAALLN
jgi:hypothetical protein